jgi:hypothetical protein
MPSSGSKEEAVSTENIDDFGFSTVDVEPAGDAGSLEDHARAEEYARKLEKVWSTIEPFLDNLARNPTKDIHWPDRDVKIAEFKKKLRRILDNPGVS